MPVKKVLGTLKSYVKRKKVEKSKGKALERNSRALAAQKKVGVKGTGSARVLGNEEDQRACVAAQLLNGHVPEGMGIEEAFSFVDPAGWEEGRHVGDVSDAN